MTQFLFRRTYGCYTQSLPWAGADFIYTFHAAPSETTWGNPGIDTCVAYCQRRYSDWRKHRRPEDERSPLEELLPWVRDYEQREDEFSLARHRAIFDRFDGLKTEYNELPSLE